MSWPPPASARAPRILLVPVAIVAALMLAALVPARADAAPFRLAEVASGLDRALYVTAPPGDRRRLFVVQQTGEIRIVRDGRLVGRPFLDVGGLITTEGFEQGLLGLAFHPDYARNGRFFVNYTNRAGDTRVVEYRVGARTPNRANPRSARTVIGFDQPFTNHNGGHLVFGPDGFLHIGSGDGGGGGDPAGNGQRVDTLLGKILRIDVDRRTGGRPYAIPRANPFAGERGPRNARPEILAYGLRNPWRFSFDRTRRDLWMGDVGQNLREEVNFRARGRLAGANFGWSTFEGSRRYERGGPARGRVIPPVAEYGRSVGCSVTGGYVYRGMRVPALRGRYLYADFCTGALFSMRAGPDLGRPRRERDLNVDLAGVTSFGEDTRGDVYVVASGSVYRIVPLRRASAAAAERAPRRLVLEAVRRVRAALAKVAAGLPA